MPDTFRSKYCAEHHLREDAFVDHLFWASIPASLWPLARLMWSLYPRYFALDRRLITHCAQAESLAVIDTELSGFFSNAYEWGFLRKRLGLRVSATKLLRQARSVLPPTRGDAARKRPARRRV